MKLDKLTGAGLALIVAICMVTSYTTLAELAQFAGWDEYMSWLFPAALDVLSLVACRIWLSPQHATGARTYAKWVTLVAAVLSVIGNGVGHLTSTGHLGQSLLLVVLVGSVAPAALVTAVHLTSLAKAPVPGRKARHKQADRVEHAPDAVDSAESKPAEEKRESKPTTKPGPRVDDLMVQKAKRLDDEHQEKHGRPISRDKVREALGTSNEKAGEALRLAREGAA